MKMAVKTQRETMHYITAAMSKTETCVQLANINGS